MWFKVVNKKCWCLTTIRTPTTLPTNKWRHSFPWSEVWWHRMLFVVTGFPSGQTNRGIAQYSVVTSLSWLITFLVSPSGEHWARKPQKNPRTFSFLSYSWYKLSGPLELTMCVLRLNLEDTCGFFFFFLNFSTPSSSISFMFVSDHQFQSVS